MNNGLKSIILHDSYFAGKLTRLPCEGHTNNTGDNGAGKTSALTLIPVFYGQLPDRLLERSGNKKKFVDFYLPRPQSMIVFEYNRQDGPCCAVLYRNSNTLAYRFVQGQADDTIFESRAMACLRDGMPAKILLKEILPTSATVSKQINSTIDYRSIIQNDIKRLRIKSKGSQSFVADARQFSLCDPTSQMLHIESLTSVLLKHERLLEQFKTMVVDSFLVDQLEIGESPYNKKDKALIYDLQSLRDFETNRTKLTSALNDYDHLLELWSLNAAHQSQISQLLTDTNHQLSENQAKQQTLKTKQEDCLTQYGDERKKLKLKLGDLESKKETTNNHLNRLYEQRQSWDDQDIEAKKAALKRINDDKTAMNEAHAHYLQLIDTVRQEQVQHDTVKLTIEKRAEQQRKGLDQDLQAQKAVLFEHQQAHQVAITTLEKLCQKEIDSQRDQRTAAENLIRQRLTDAQVKVAVAGHLTDEENHQLGGLNEQLEGLEGSLELCRKSIHEVTQNRYELKSKQAEWLEQQKKASEKLAVKYNSRTDISQQLFPAGNSLKAFLAKADIHWRDSIGKVIKTDVLLNSKLSPTLVDDDPAIKSLYGVLLSLDAIEPGEAALSNEKLEGALDNLQKDIQVIEQDIDVVKKRLKQVNIDIVKTDSEQAKYQRQEQELNKSKKQLRSLIKQKQAEFKELGQLRVKQSQQDKDEVDNELVQFERTTKSLMAQISSRYTEQKLGKEADFGIEMEQFNEQVRGLEQKITAHADNLKLRLKELDQQFNAVLEDKGVDSKAVEKARERFETAEQRVLTVESYRDTISAFTLWQQTEWVEKDRLDQAFSQLQSEMAELELLIVNKKNVFEKRNKDFKDMLSQLKKLGTKLELCEKQANQCLSNIEQAREGMSDDISASSIGPYISVELLIEQVNETVNQVKELKKSIIKAVKNVSSLLTNQNEQSKVGQMWSHLSEKRQEKSDYDSYSNEFYLECIVDIKTLLEDSVSSITGVTIESVKAVGARIIRFHESLDSLNRKVEQVSGKLDSNINTQHQFPALTDIKVAITSKVREYDIWSELQGFAQQWEIWHDDGSDDLPDADFVVAFGAVLDGLKSSDITGKAGSLVDLRISLSENGRIVAIHNDRDLMNVSSTGISMLAVIVVFCGMTRYLCNDANVRIHWPLDELGKLSTQNTRLLFQFMDEHNITLFCAQPNPPASLRQFFTSKNHLVKDSGVQQYNHWRSQRSNPLLGGKVDEVVAVEELGK